MGNLRLGTVMTLGSLDGRVFLAVGFMLNVRAPSRAGSLPQLIFSVHTLYLHRKSPVGASLLAMNDDTV
ncbi:hypothetical protein B0E42_18530 [Pseudomonas sp. A25(2017)]|nr:hypothetical protein B0E42_18530 [Pseudomonas sp. A25(2017)]